MYDDDSSIVVGGGNIVEFENKISLTLNQFSEWCSRNRLYKIIEKRIFIMGDFFYNNDLKISKMEPSGLLDTILDRICLGMII